MRWRLGRSRVWGLGPQWWELGRVVGVEGVAVVGAVVTRTEYGSAD